MIIHADFFTKSLYKSMLKSLSTMMLLVILAILFLSFSSQASSAKPQAKQPNILFILSDNQHAGLLGTYGNTDIKTPNIDKLAAQGVKFTKAFAVSGMCSPTRATILTGLMPSQHGLHDWLDDELMVDLPRNWQAIAEFKSVPYALGKNGYQTAMVGKWHLGQPWHAANGFDHWLTFSSGHTLDFWKNTVIENGKVFDIEGQHMVDYFGDKSVDYLNDYKGDKPFFLQVSFDGPYMDPPTNMGPAKNRHYEYYKKLPLNSFPRTAVNSNYLNQLLEFTREGNDHFFLSKMLKMVIGQVAGDHDTLANMASQNTIVDDNVGKLLTALKNNGLDKNTIIIYSSDQGTYYGQQGLWTHTILSQPSTLNETAFHIPLIVKLPKQNKSKVVDELIGQYDIAPTILDLAGINDSFTGSPGKTFTPMLTQRKSKAIHEDIFYEQTETRAIRTKKYVYWKRMDQNFGDDELYNMVDDPLQNINIIGQKEYQAVVADLDERLQAFHQQYADPKYNLWLGGIAKGTLSYPEKFKKRFGQQWRLQSEVLPDYSEKSSVQSNKIDNSEPSSLN